MNITSLLHGRDSDPWNNRPVLITCLGDSVTHGCFDVFVGRDGGIDTVYDPSQGYVARLAHALHRLYPKAAVSVLNAGIGGDSAPNGLKRLDRDVLDRRPDLVIVNYGLNDSMNPEVEPGLRTYSEAMRSIFQSILAAGAEAMLLTPNFMNDYVSPALSGDLLRDVADRAAVVQNEGVLARYVQAARGVATELHVPIADAHARWQALKRAGVDTTALLSNHINHPTAELHDLFVEEIVRTMLGD